MTPAAIITVVLMILAIFLAFRYDIAKKKREAARKALYDSTLAAKQAAYQQALQKDDKQLALRLGREYYAFLRGGTLSVYDEQALANDLSTMK